MSKVDKKIISIFLLLIMLIAQISPVFAATNELQTLENYLIENEVDANKDGILSETEWATVKNLDLDGREINIADIEKAVNLETLRLIYADCSVIDFSKLVNLQYLSLYNCDPNKVDFSKLSNLKGISLIIEEFSNKMDLNLCNMKELESLTIMDKSPSVYDYENGIYIYNEEIKSCISNLNISELSNLKDIYLSGTYSCNIAFPNLKNIETIHVETDNLLKLDLRESKKLIDALFKHSHEMGFFNGQDILLNDNLIVTEDFAYGAVAVRIYPKEEFEIVKGAKLYEEHFGYGTHIEGLENSKILEQKDGYIVAKNIGTEEIKVIDELLREVLITVNVIDKKTIENVDTTLENSGITAKFVSNYEILKSNGELWEVNSETTAEKKDTNVKDYISEYVYARGTSELSYLTSTLKNDNSLTINCDGMTKKVSNVQNIEKNIYLTTDGKLYELGINYITEQINPKLIREDVKKLIGDCIVLKDGTTWYQKCDGYYNKTYDLEFEKLADFEIKDMNYSKYYKGAGYWMIPTVIDYQNNLWCCVNKDYYFNNSGLEILQENFEGYELPPYIAADCAGIDGIMILDNKDVVPVYYNEEGKRVAGEEVILSNVSQAYYNYMGEGYILIRTDGTIWTYNEKYGLTKIIKSTESEVEPPIVEKEEYIKNPIIKEKEVGGDTVISGIGANKKVEDLLKDNNFNNRYTLKVYDSNNNLVASTELLGTGVTVKLYNENNEIVQEYVIVIYGDTTGDGVINAVDALTLIKGINNKVPFKSEIHKEAGNIVAASGQTPSAVDALAIVKAANNKYTINQSK